MHRIKCTISYDGTGFNGFQIQIKGRTVQGEIESALTKMHKGDAIRIFASGRTDTGVHAVGQVIHFDSPLSIPPINWIRALNGLLPPDITVINAEPVHPGFHARFDVKKKEYRYRLYTGPYSVFNRNLMYFYPYSLDIEKMEEAMSYFIGTHDFTSFCSAKTVVENKVRTLYEINCIKEKENELVFRFVGNGFLYNMVRILTGTLLEVGRGRIPPEDMPAILELRNRDRTGKTAPGHGLYLWGVWYE